MISSNCVPLFSGYCDSLGLCVSGNATGPTPPSLNCTLPNWVWGPTSTCPVDDACHEYSSSCLACSKAPPELSCGYCSDTNLCSAGNATGPSSGECTPSSWSLQSCGAAALCASAFHCAQCLDESIGENCGWCATSGLCMYGDGDGPMTGQTCPSYAWKFNTDFSSSTLQCFVPTPYQHEQTTLTQTDNTVFILIGVCAFLFIGATYLFSCCGCRCLVPQYGDARKRTPEEMMEERRRQHHLNRYDQDEDSEDEYEGRPKGCCKTFNNACGRILLWFLALVTLCLSIAALALDVWSFSHLPSSPSAPSTYIAEGVLQNYIWFNRVSLSALIRAPSSATSFSYDCSSAEEAALTECYVHFAGGLATLVMGVLSTLCAGIVVLQATSNLCCSSKFLPEAKYDPLHILKVQYPFVAYQWRLAMLASLYAFLSASIYGVSSYILSEQYYSSTLELHLSFYLMIGSGLAGMCLAFAYRRAIIVTPRDGYALRPREQRTRTNSILYQYQPTHFNTGLVNVTTTTVAPMPPAVPTNTNTPYTHQLRQSMNPSTPPTSGYQSFHHARQHHLQTPPTHRSSTRPSHPSPFFYEPSFQRDSGDQSGSLGSPLLHSHMTGHSNGDASMTTSDSSFSTGYVVVPASEAAQYLSRHSNHHT